MHPLLIAGVISLLLLLVLKALRSQTSRQQQIGFQSDFINDVRRSSHIQKLQAVYDRALLPPRERPHVEEGLVGTASRVSLILGAE